VLNKVVRLSQNAYDALEEVRKQRKLTTISDAVMWLCIAEDLHSRIDHMEKQIAYLLEQVGGAGEGHSTSV
jgi:hypothetical protein